MPGLRLPKSTSVSALFHPLSVGHQLSNASLRESCPLASKVATGLGARFAQVKFSVVIPSASVSFPEMQPAELVVIFYYVYKPETIRNEVYREHYQFHSLHLFFRKENWN